MKRLLFFLLVFISLFCFTSCGKTVISNDKFKDLSEQIPSKEYRKVEFSATIDGVKIFEKYKFKDNKWVCETSGASGIGFEYISHDLSFALRMNYTDEDVTLEKSTSKYKLTSIKEDRTMVMEFNKFGKLTFCKITESSNSTIVARLHWYK